jgi:hypothetical protein
MTIPAPNPAARTPLYVSSSTQSVSFEITGTSYKQVMAVTPSSPGCTTDDKGNRTCVLDADVPPGANQTLLVKTFASTDGTGTPLSQNSVVMNVVSGQDNPVSLTLNVIISSVDFWFTGTLTAGTAGTIQVAWDGKDAAGNYIVGLPQYDVNGVNISSGNFTVSDTTHFTWSHDANGNLLLNYDGGSTTTPTVSLDVNSGEFTATHPVPLD